MGSLVRVTIASESAYEINCSLHASVVYLRVLATLGFVPAEPPMMAQPRHQLSLGSLHGRHAATGMSPTMLCV